MRRLDNIEPVLTDAFKDMVLALDKALQEQTIVGVTSERGVGFKFAVRRFAMKHYLKIVYASVEKYQSFHQVLCSLNEEISNLKFSDIDTRNTNLHMLTIALNKKLKHGDTALLVLDNCAFTPCQLQYFTRFLQNFQCHTGLLFRMNTKYIRRISGVAEKWEEPYSKLLKFTKHWKNISAIDDDDVRDIVASHGVSDQMITEDLVEASARNLSILNSHIERYLERKTKSSERLPTKK